MVVPEAFQALKQCAEMLGDSDGSRPWWSSCCSSAPSMQSMAAPGLVRKQAVDALGARWQPHCRHAAGWRSSPDDYVYTSMNG